MYSNRNSQVGRGEFGMMNSESAPLLQFPTDYPIKVLGPPTDEFRARVHAILLKHAPDLDPQQVTERLSSNGRFVAISYLIVAQSREQVTALALDLKICPDVLMII
jgi:uncharacterized protein